MTCFHQNGSWSLTLLLPWVWLEEDEVSVFFPAQQGYWARIREKTFWMPFPNCFWHYRPLLTPSAWSRYTLYSSLISLCLYTHPVLLLIVWVHCSLSSLASFLSWSHFLSHTACNYTHIHTQTTERGGKEEGAWGERVNVWERRKERVASICVLSVLFSWDKTWLTSSLTCQWERKNCQIVFQDDMQLTAFRVMRKQVWLPIIPFAFELCCVKLLCFLESKHP